MEEWIGVLLKGETVPNIHVNILHKSTQEPSGSPASEKILSLLWKAKVHYSIQRSLPLYPTMSHLK
jgi:hypothetical protein